MDMEELHAVVERQQNALEMMLEAMALHQAAIEELHAHSDRHLAVLKRQGKVIRMLEQMMIGGSDETPPAPPVS